MDASKLSESDYLALDAQCTFYYKEDLYKAAADNGYKSVVQAVVELYSKVGSVETAQKLGKYSRQWVIRILKKFGFYVRDRGGPHNELRDLTGERFGNLKVLYRVPKPEGKTGGNKWYRVLCDCGREYDIIAYVLTRTKRPPVGMCARCAQKNVKLRKEVGCGEDK